MISNEQPGNFYTLRKERFQKYELNKLTSRLGIPHPLI